MSVNHGLYDLGAYTNDVYAGCVEMYTGGVNTGNHRANLFAGRVKNFYLNSGADVRDDKVLSFGLYDGLIICCILHAGSWCLVYDHSV